MEEQKELLEFMSQVPKTFKLLSQHSDVVEELDGVLQKEDPNLFVEFISVLRSSQHGWECTEIPGGFACKKVSGMTTEKVIQEILESAAQIPDAIAELSAEQMKVIRNNMKQK